MRTQIEADLLLQNLMLTADAMGLGAWIHASLAPPILLGDPKFTKQYGPMLGFDWSTPKWKPAGHSSAGRCRCPNTPTCAPPASGCATRAST